MAIMSRPIDLHKGISSMRKGTEDGANSKPSVTLELQAFEQFSKRKQGLESQSATSPKSASSVILSDTVVPFLDESSSRRGMHAESCSTSVPLQRCWAAAGSFENWQIGLNKAELSDESMMVAASFDSSCFHGHHSELSLNTVTQMQTSPHQDNQLRLFTARSWQEQSSSLNFVDAMRVNESELNFHHPNASLGSLFASPHLLSADSTPGLYGYSIEPVQSQEDERERSLDASMLDLTSKLGSSQDVTANASLLPETAGDFPMQMGFNYLEDSHTLSLRSHRYIPSGLEADTYIKPTYSEAIYLSNEDLESPPTFQYASNLRLSGLHSPAIPEDYFLNSHSVNGNSFEFLRNPMVSVDGRQALETTANWADSYYATSNVGLNWKEESKSHFPLSMQNDWQNLNAAMHKSSLVLGFSQDQRSLKRPMHMDMEHTSSDNKRMHVENGALKRSSSWTSLGYEDVDTRDEVNAVSFKPSSSGKKTLGPALNTNLKPRARQGSANDPQSIAARHRRERISERLKILQNLIPNGSKVDLVTMLEKAITYVKFLQLQVRVLTTDEYWPNQDAKEKQSNQQDAAEVTSKASPNDDGDGGGDDDECDDQLPPVQTDLRESKPTQTKDLACQPSSSQ